MVIRITALRGVKCESESAREVINEHRCSRKANSDSNQKYFVCDRFLSRSNCGIAVCTRNCAAVQLKCPRASRETANELCVRDAGYGADCNGDGKPSGN